MKSLRTHVSHFALLLAGVWVLAFAVLPHHHDPDSGMPCLDLHGGHHHSPAHDDCGLSKAFVIEWQREDDLVHFLYVHAQMLPDVIVNIAILNTSISRDIQAKPYQFALHLNERVCPSPGRAPPIA